MTDSIDESLDNIHFAQQALKKSSQMAAMAREIRDLREQLRAAAAAPRPVRVRDWVQHREAVTPQYVTESGQVLQVNGNPEWYKRVVYVEVAKGESGAASRFKIGDHVRVVSENGPIKAGHSVGTVGTVVKVDDTTLEGVGVVVDALGKGTRWHTPGDLEHASTMQAPKKKGTGWNDGAEEKDTIAEAVKRRTRHLERRIQSQRAQIRFMQAKIDAGKAIVSSTNPYRVVLLGIVRTSRDYATRVAALALLGEHQ